MSNYIYDPNEIKESATVVAVDDREATVLIGSQTFDMSAIPEDMRGKITPLVQVTVPQEDPPFQVGDVLEVYTILRRP